MTLARFALIAALGCGSTAWAQTTTGTTTGTSTGTSNGPAGASATPNSGFQGTQMEGSPTISGGGSTGANVNSFNIFASSYANPYYQGRPGTTTAEGPGGFGTALAGGSGSGTAGRSSSITSRATGSSSTASRTTSGASTTGSTLGRTTSGTSSPSLSSVGSSSFGSGFGSTGSTGFGSTGRTGTTGFGTTGTNRGTGTGFSNNTQQQGVLATQTRPVAVSVVARFPVKPVLPAATTGEITTALARSSYLTNAGSIQVHHDGGRLVTLRGQVKDAEEAQAAEGIARLTPGVREVKNELTYPK